MLLDQRQHGFQPVFLTGHGVDEGLALIDGKPGFKGCDDGTVDGERHICQALDQLDSLGEDARLIGERDTGIHVQHMGARRHLRESIGFDPAVIAVLHLLGQQFPPRRVDPLPDNYERSIEPDDNFLGRGGNEGVSHIAIP